MFQNFKALIIPWNDVLAIINKLPCSILDTFNLLIYTLLTLKQFSSEINTDNDKLVFRKQDKIKYLKFNPDMASFFVEINFMRNAPKNKPFTILEEIIQISQMKNEYQRGRKN